MLRSGDMVREVDVLGVALRRKQGEGPQKPTRVPQMPLSAVHGSSARGATGSSSSRATARTRRCAVGSGILQNSRASDVPALYLYEP